MRVLLPASGFVILASLVTFVLLEQPDWLPGFLRSPAKARVLVFLVGDDRGVEGVRRAVDPARVVYASDDALALVEGRIVATDAAAVSEPVNAAGWGDRRIEIFHVSRDDRPPTGRGGSEAGEVDPERLARLRELVHKPTLTYGEQIFVLQAMNDGIAF